MIKGTPLHKVEIKTTAILKEGMFSDLLVDGTPIAVVIERTYELNENPGEPIKIGPGYYHCFLTTYHKGGYETFEIKVPGHSLIKFHKANWETDLDGCPGVGEKFETINGKLAIAESGKGFDDFMEAVGDLDNFILKVTR